MTVQEPRIDTPFLKTPVGQRLSIPGVSLKQTKFDIKIPFKLIKSAIILLWFFP